MNAIRALFFVGFLWLVRGGMIFLPAKKYREKARAVNGENHRSYPLESTKGWKYNSKPMSKNKGDEKHYYYSIGDDLAIKKPVMLCLHGLSFDGRTFLNLAPLQKNFRLLAYEFPEESMHYKFNLDDFCDLVYDFISQMGLKRVVLIGVSFGGVVSVHFAAKYPEIVIRLIILSTPAAGVTAFSRIRSWGMGRWVKSMKDYMIYYFMEKSVSQFINNFKGKEKDELAPLAKIKKTAFYRQLSYSLNGYNATSDLQMIHVPSLILQGSKDNLIPVQEAYRLHGLISGSTIQVIEGATHAMVVLQANKVVEAIEQFLKKE